MKTATKILNYTELSEGISEWLKEYANKAGARGFVIGVSGGIDSAVVSALCAKTGLNLLVLEMPIHQGSAEVGRAQDHIKWLKANYPNVESKVVDLTDAYDILYEDLAQGTPPFGRQISQEDYNFSMANTRSRLRMTSLYAYAGMYKMLVAGTGNKVEDFGIGFYTKYGDGGVDISPIADLMKSEVYALGAEFGIIESILTAAPTDGLHSDSRTDEEQLKCTYSELEWAMNFENKLYVFGDMKDHYVRGRQEAIKEDEESKLSDRQKEVLNIYRYRHNANLHKMTPIPIFSTYSFRK